MIRIDVIGDIGSGKSYVAKQFGYPVFNADIEVTKLYRKNRKCYKKLKKALPKYIVSFPVKKNVVSGAIMSGQNNLKKIIKQNLKKNNKKHISGDFGAPSRFRDAQGQPNYQPKVYFWGKVAKIW